MIEPLGTGWVCRWCGKPTTTRVHGRCRQCHKDHPCQRCEEIEQAYGDIPVVFEIVSPEEEVRRAALDHRGEP